MRLLRTLSLCTVMTLGAAMPVLAAPFTLDSSNTTQVVTYGPAPGCTTCSVTVTYSLINEIFTVAFENTSTDGVASVNILTGVGFNTTPDIGATGWTVNIEGGLSWSVSAGGGGLGNFEIVPNSDQGVNNGLDNQSNLADSGSVSKDVNLTSLTIDGSSVHIQALANGDSIKLPGNDNEVPQVPEPATLLLLGSGFLAIGRSRFLRRN